MAPSPSAPPPMAMASNNSLSMPPSIEMTRAGPVPTAVPVAQPIGVLTIVKDSM